MIPKITIIGRISKGSDGCCLKIDIHRENDDEIIIRLFDYGMLHMKNKDTHIYISTLHSSNHAEYEFKYIIQKLKEMFHNVTYELYKYDETINLYGTTINI